VLLLLLLLAVLLPAVVLLLLLLVVIPQYPGSVLRLFGGSSWRMCCG
jgi:hypothetical protein